MKQNNKRVINFLWCFGKKYKYKMLAIFFFENILTMLKELVFKPYILSIAGNAFVKKTLNLFLVIFIPLAYSFLSCLNYFIDMTFGWKLHYNTISKLEKDIRIYLMKYSMNHSVNYFKNKMSGVIAAKINNIVENISSFFLLTIEVFASYLIFIFIICLYFNINSKLAMFIIIWSICYYLAQFLLGKMLYKTRKEAVIEDNIISGLMNDSLSNISTIKSFANQRNELLKVKKQGKKVLKKISDKLWTQIFSNITMFILTSSLLGFIIGFGFYLTSKKEISLGVFLFICQNIIMTNSLIADSYEKTIQLITNFSDIKEGVETIIVPIDIKDKKDAKKLDLISGKITFRDINFSHDSSTNKK